METKVTADHQRFRAPGDIGDQRRRLLPAGCKGLLHKDMATSFQQFFDLGCMEMIRCTKQSGLKGSIEKGRFDRRIPNEAFLPAGGLPDLPVRLDHGGTQVRLLAKEFQIE
jgi:hypothetical protein